MVIIEKFKNAIKEILKDFVTHWCQTNTMIGYSWPCETYKYTQVQLMIWHKHYSQIMEKVCIEQTLLQIWWLICLVGTD